MKKILLFLMLMCAMLITSCNERTRYLTPKGDSIRTAKLIDKIVNPVFTSVESLSAYQDIDIQEHKIGDIFRAMPKTTLQKVATVCINKTGKVSKKSLVNEYLANSSVYDNLSDDTSSYAIQNNPKPDTQTSDSVTVDIKSPTGDVIRTAKDTIIDGELVTIISYNKK